MELSPTAWQAGWLRHWHGKDWRAIINPTSHAKIGVRSSIPHHMQRLVYDHQSHITYKDWRAIINPTSHPRTSEDTNSHINTHSHTHKHTPPHT